mmetsp:Transcript_14759/g.37018  ORF Transcript_14759/g.37018 Transcript_14759/m.37018 type:complete len:248 (+) Transcript_14759:214-957(+)
MSTEPPGRRGAAVPGAAQGGAEAEVEAEEGALPRQFFCPITCQPMVDPVVCSDGFTYERSAIAAWLQRKAVSPMTRQRVSPRLHPNHALRQMIEEARPGSTAPTATLQPAVCVLPGGGLQEADECAAVAGCRRLRALLDGAAKLRWRCDLLWWLLLRHAAAKLGLPARAGSRRCTAEAGRCCERLRQRLAASNLGAAATPFIYTAAHWAGILTLHTYARISLPALLRSASAGCRVAAKCVRTLLAFH